jgi:hypothetical protein
LKVAISILKKFLRPLESSDDNAENEDIIIPVCTLLIAAGIQQYRGNHFGRLWVGPWIARRNQYGAYHALVQALLSRYLLYRVTGS